MDQEFDRRIAECEVKIDNCKTRMKDSGEDGEYLSQRLKDLNGVREKLVEQKANS